ncbi:MAG: carboxypeptidase-like regulatory domain-containing protein [Chloroflexota bacterium]
MTQKTVRVTLALSLSLLLLIPLGVWAANILDNPGLEDDYVQYDTYNNNGVDWKLQVANSWERFEIRKDRLRFFTASDWAAFNGSPVVEKRDGSQAQVWWSSRKFDAGLYQQVSGLTIGEHYGFQAGILQVFETTNQSTPNTGNMLRSVGIDPYGGTDEEASTVIWGPEEPNATYTQGEEKFTWFYPGVGATALSTTVTVFVRVQSLKNATTPNSNQVWVDDTFMDIAPTTDLTLSATSTTEVMAEWSGTPRTDFSLFAYEAQYRKEADSDWIDLQIFDVDTLPSQNTSASITVEENVSYVVRARTWHEQINGDGHEVPGPWVEKTIQAGGAITGVVTTPSGVPLSGVTVTANSTTTAQTTGDGSYTLSTGAGTFAITAANKTGWQTLDPITITLAATQTVSLPLTLYPPHNAIVNGGLEGSLQGWTSSLTSAMGSAVEFDGLDRRSGNYSLVISGTGSLTQTGIVTNAYQPTLTFWYQTKGGDGDDTLVAQIVGDYTLPSLAKRTVFLPPTTPITLTQSSGWEQVTLPLVLSGTTVYTGNIDVQFLVNQVGLTPTQFYLDEVVLGQSYGGPETIYLPVILR